MSLPEAARLPLAPPLARTALLAALAGVTALAFLAALGIGAVPIPPGRVLAILLGRAEDARQAAIVLDLRLPRAILGLLVGGALGLAGAALQGLFRNPLADPGLIGVSGGAALAAVAAIVLGDRLAAAIPLLADRHLLPVAAFLGGLLATGVTRRLAERSGLATGALILAGIAVNTLLAAATGLLVTLSDDRQLRDIVFWSMGSLATAGWSGAALAAPFVAAALLLLARTARPLDALLLGEREALHLGIEVERLKRRVLVAVAIAVGAAVAVSGVIGFVGIVVPHLVRLVAGPGHRTVLPGAALFGAALLLAADSLARILAAPAELPVGLVTSAIGGPCFIWLLARRTRL